MAKGKKNGNGEAVRAHADSDARGDLAAGDMVAYRVAELAWAKGLAPNSISRVYRELHGTELTIMQVKRALDRAIRRGFLTIHAPIETKLRAELEGVKEWKSRQYTVVNDTMFSDSTDAVSLAAAEKIVEIIERRLRAPGEVVVANSGGQSISRTVQYVHALAPVLDEEDRKRLIFISLNSAGRRVEFNQSSNFLAVRLAEIFGGRHIAVLDGVDRASEEAYEQKVQDISLLICGAGGRESLLELHASEKKVALPPDFVGDLAFQPLTREGRPCRDKALLAALEPLHMHPDYEEIQRIALDPSREVLVIFTGKVEVKVDITRAILTAGLATQCVLGVSLVKRLLARAARAKGGRGE